MSKCVFSLARLSVQGITCFFQNADMNPQIFGPLPFGINFRVKHIKLKNGNKFLFFKDMFIGYYHKIEKSQDIKTFFKKTR